MISSAIWDKSAQVNFSGLTKFAVFFFLHSRVLIYPKLHEKNHVVTCLMSRFFSFTCHRISLIPVPAYKWQPRPRMVKILTGECWNVCKEKCNPFFLFFCCFSWQTAFWWIALHCDPRRKNPGTVWCNLQVYLQERRWCMNKSCSSVHWLNSIQKKFLGWIKERVSEIYRGWSASKRILQLLP